MPIDLMPEAWQRALLLPLIGLLLESADNSFKSASAQAVNLIVGFMPQTEPEFRLAVRICILNLQSNRAFGWAGLEETTVPDAIRLQRNGLALIKAADEAQSRLQRLQIQRIERTKQAAVRKQTETNSRPEAARTETPKTETPKTETGQPRPTVNDAKAINEYARAHNMTYAQAWGLIQRARKAAEAQQHSVSVRKPFESLESVSPGGLNPLNFL